MLMVPTEASVSQSQLNNNFSRLETGRNHRDSDSLPAGEEGRGGVHLHRGEQRREAPVPGLPQGDRQAAGPGAVQPDLPRGQGGRHPDVPGLWGSSAQDSLEKMVQKVSQNKSCSSAN